MTNKTSHRNQRTKRVLIALKYLASLGILTWLLYNYRDQFPRFLEEKKQYHWLALSLVTMTCAFMLSYIRWHQLATAIGLQLSLRDAFRLGFIGAFFNVVAFGVVGGDSLRAFYVARKSPGKITESILSVFIDRVIGLITMCGFAAVAYLINGIPGQDSVQKRAIEYGCQIAGLASGCGILTLLLLLFYPQFQSTRLFSLFRSIPKLGPIIGQVADAFVLYSQRRSVILIAMMCSVSTNVMFSTTVFLVAHAISLPHPPLLDHFVMAPIAMVANSIPLPGGVGGMEASLAYLYQCFGYSSGLLVALGYRLSLLFVSLIGWGVWLRFGELTQPGSTTSAEDQTTADPNAVDSVSDSEAKS